MKRKYSLLGLAAGTALLVATGCSKQESPSTASADSATKAPAPAAASTPQVAETPKPADKPAAAAAKPEAAVASMPVAMTPPPATTNPAPTVTAATNAAADIVAAAVGTNGTLVNALQSAVKTQQVSFAQSVSNQLQTLAAAGTNQLLAALATTNQLAAGATNQLATATTNQVQQLLERAKTLCANQKYQDALSNLTVLYTTKLTPEQKQKADDLKAQIQAGLTQKATSALGNLFNGSK